MHALRLHSCKKFKIQIQPDHGTVRYSTVRYGTEELPGPALLLPDNNMPGEIERARKKKKERVLQLGFIILKLCV